MATAGDDGEGFGQRLQEALERAGKTQSDLARHLGISRGPISQWIAGKYSPSPGNLRKTADYLGVNVNWLTANRGTMIVSPQDLRITTAEGQRVDIAGLDRELARRLGALLEGRPRAEIWRLSSDHLAAASLNRGDYLVVDLGAQAKPRDIVMANHRGTPVFRLFFPPYLIGASLTENPKPLLVDEISVITQGVVIERYSAAF